MNLFIVTEDLGDGDVALRYFSTKEYAERYMKQNEEWCYHEGNPHKVCVDSDFEFDDGDVQ